jgi:hypothetical protein
MAICPFATWKPLPANGKQPRMVPRVAILHTAVDAPGPSDLYGWFVQSGLESHFFVHNDGRITQYMDTVVVAEANYLANPFAVSIETEDEGNPRTREWTAAQVASIIRLLDWLCTVHPTIPRKLCDRWDGAGVGWHSMWGYNTATNRTVNRWTTALGKDCPTAPRIAQTKNIILPRLAGGPKQEDEMLTPTQNAWLEDILRRVQSMHVYGFEAIDPIKRVPPGWGAGGDLSFLEKKTAAAVAPVLAELGKLRAEVAAVARPVIDYKLLAAEMAAAQAKANADEMHRRLEN